MNISLPDAKVMPDAKVRELHARARYDALRRRVFEDMGRTSARWRLTWILPFHALVIALLVFRGESAPRALAQAVVVSVIGVLFVARLLSSDWRLRVGSFIIGSFGYFVLLATTGGLASPLLVTGAFMIVAAAMALRDPPWLRQIVFVIFLLGFGALALLSRTVVGALEGPLASSGGLSSSEYVSLALLAAVFAMVGVYNMGCTLTRGYETAALELAERREELCTENEDRTRALEGIAARLAHEVKNPLAAIRALSTHMARNATDARTAERLAIVAGEASRLQSIVDGFLSFSRGLDDLKLAPVNPYEVARELAVLLETRAAEAGITLDVAGEATFVLDADARKLRQALLNLVLNAVQASPRSAAVKVTVSAEAAEVRITVQDDGVGMTPEVLERIRKPYFTTKEGGTGLGVAVARGLVEQHGGRLEFTSASGKGTTVTLALPRNAKPCPCLPNPARAVRHEAEAGESRPVIAGVS
ncbi:MAG: HAMP domain-containing histidine kinase [Myxococcota bacterium]|nr:HAMP domain-containing histidine kinase [Myxococcota bacterium]